VVIESIILNNSVSAITESLVTESIKTSISAYQQSRKIEDDTFAAQMKSLELKVGSIQEQVAAMATKIQTAILHTLTGENGVISAQNSKFAQLASVVDHLADSITEVLEHDRARDSTDPTTTPLRNRKKTKPSVAPDDEIQPPAAVCPNTVMTPERARTEDTDMNVAPPEPPDPSQQ
jgi:hypothetical protein